MQPRGADTCVVQCDKDYCTAASERAHTLHMTFTLFVKDGLIFQMEEKWGDLTQNPLGIALARARVSSGFDVCNAFKGEACKFE